MNIAYLSADFGVPIFGYKGASIHVREMVTALCRAGHSVCLFSPAIEEGKEESETKSNEASASHFAKSMEGVSFFPVLPPERHLQLFRELEAVDKLLNKKTRVRQELRNLLYNLEFYEKAREVLQHRPLDFIYERYALFSIAGVRLAKELGVPHILEVNAPLAYEQEKMRGLEMKVLAAESERQIFSETNRVIVVSKLLQQHVCSCGVPEPRIRVLPNAVDPQRFAAAEQGGAIREQYKLNGKRTIGFVGSLKPWHGTETLLAAFGRLHASMPQAHLLIVGDGPARESLEQQAQVNGIREAVTFTGNIPYDEVPDYIAAMDIAVAPYTPNENFYYSPIKIFEYMMMGKPVVAGCIGQVAELIEDGKTGVLYKPGNVNELAAALMRLVRDPLLCDRIGESEREWVRRERTWASNARQVIELVHEVLQHS